VSKNPKDSMAKSPKDKATIRVGTLSDQGLGRQQTVVNKQKPEGDGLEETKLNIGSDQPMSKTLA
jgi:hypothetical protein